MKFRIISSLVVLVAIVGVFILTGGLDTVSTNKRPSHSDGIKLNQ